jgi:hypothetical protein
MSGVRCFLFFMVGVGLVPCPGVAEEAPTASSGKSATALPEDPQALVRLLMRKPSLIGPLLDMKFLDLLEAAQGDKVFFDRDGNPGRVPIPSRDASQPAMPAGSARDRAKRTAVVTAIITKIPAGCRVLLGQDTGGSALAIPPPMNDDEPAQVERIEEAIRGLQAGIEIMATCQRGRLAASPLFGLNLFHDGSSWRIRAWRDLRPSHARRAGF